MGGRSFTTFQLRADQLAVGSALSHSAVGDAFYHSAVGDAFDPSSVCESPRHRRAQGFFSPKSSGSFSGCCMRHFAPSGTAPRRYAPTQKKAPTSQRSGREKEGSGVGFEKAEPAADDALKMSFDEERNAVVVNDVLGER